MSVLQELEKWFIIHCDNDWEHEDRISIINLDNPGWQVKINLEDTLLEDEQFDEIVWGNSESRDNEWIDCSKEEAFFIGMGSANMLEYIISVFLNWANEKTNTVPWNQNIIELTEKLKGISEENDKIKYLRNIYQEIVDIPNEHPQKKQLLEMFYLAWNNEINNITN